MEQEQQEEQLVLGLGAGGGTFPVKRTSMCKGTEVLNHGLVYRTGNNTEWLKPPEVGEREAKAGSPMSLYPL